MKILGLDVSTKSTGWFITKRSCGKIIPEKSLSFPEKLAVFREELGKLLVKYAPDLVIIEDTYYRPGKGSIHTLKALTKFVGVAMEVCAANGVDVEIMTATSARKHCCGVQEGPFKKREVFDFFIEKYALDWKYETYNDITDAMALVWGHREIQRIEKKSSTDKI